MRHSNPVLPLFLLIFNYRIFLIELSTQKAKRILAEWTLIFKPIFRRHRNGKFNN